MCCLCWALLVSSFPHPIYSTVFLILTSDLAGGVKRPESVYQVTQSQVSCVLLVMGTIVTLMPSACPIDGFFGHKREPLSLSSHPCHCFVPGTSIRFVRSISIR